ncbi:VOC family protein [Mycobacteroides abscessus]
MNGPREEQTAALQVTRFDHIVINCRDVDITAAWYERVLGMSRETFGPAARTALTFGMQKINLRPIAATQDEWFTGVAAAVGSDDLCFITGAAPAQVRAHLEACGVPIEQGPVTKIGALGEMTSHYCRDPDGNLIEIAVYP